MSNIEANLGRMIWSAFITVQVLSDCLTSQEKAICKLSSAMKCWWNDYKCMSWLKILMEDADVSDQRLCSQEEFNPICCIKENKDKAQSSQSKVAVIGQFSFKERFLLFREQRKKPWKHRYLNSRTRSLDFIQNQWRFLRKLHLLIMWLYSSPSKLGHIWDWKKSIW